MTEIIEKINHLNELVRSGNAMDAFEMYYHEQVIMQENQQQPTIGKPANRKREHEFFNSIVQFRSATPLKVIAGYNVSMVQWHYDYTHKDWGERNYVQVSVQEWADGKIIKEQFFYGN